MRRLFLTSLMTIVLFLSTGLTVFAQSAVPFLDFTEVVKTLDGYEHRADLADGRVVIVVGPETLTAGQEKILGVLFNIVSSWKVIKAKTVRIQFRTDRTEVLLVPSSVLYKSKDLAQFMPAGLSFFYTDSLEYDFRIKVQNFFIRMKGQFFTEEQFADKVTSAVNNPVLYMQTTDPEYALRKFGEQDTVLEKMQNDDNELRKSITEQSDALAAQGTALTEQIADLQAQVDALKKASSDELAALSKSTDDALQLLRRVVIVLHNTGFFRGPTNVAPEIIARIVEIKAADSTATAKTIAAQMKTESLKVSEQEIKLVLQVYFQEF